MDGSSDGTADTSRFSPDTIFAFASGHGRSAIAVVRISGPEARLVLGSLLVGSPPPPRRASLRTLRDPVSKDVLDKALVLWLPGPTTFTGEDQVELHVHGGIAVRAAIARVLAARPCCRAAEPGEFTRRAFLNGRLDLTAVEGLADLIDAETEAQRRQAVRDLEGELSGRVLAWRERLADALAACEACLDFSEEEDVPTEVGASTIEVSAEVAAEVRAALVGSERAERLREGFVVVIAGPPNAGKSTLINAIARREVAIVSPVAGTTRDAIEIRCDLGGLPVTFTDTAGLRHSDDPVERLGMARSNTRIASADLVLWLTSVESQKSQVATPEARLVQEVRTKGDLLGLRETTIQGLTVSAQNGDGLQQLLDRVHELAAGALVGAGDAVVTRERHRSALQEVVACLERTQVAGPSGATELVAEDLRLALRALGRLTGRVDVEDILDRIFASFCVGK